STPAVTAGVVELTGTGLRTLAERVTVNPRAHGELLMPQLLEALAEAGRELADADAVVVGCGPGPFTGLRVGMVTAAALGQAGDRTRGPHVNRPAGLPDLGIGSAAGEMAEAVALEPVQPRHPTPAGLVSAARSQLLSGAEPAPLVPLYLRRPDADTPGKRKSVLAVGERLPTSPPRPGCSS